MAGLIRITQLPLLRTPRTPAGEAEPEVSDPEVIEPEVTEPEVTGPDEPAGTGSRWWPPALGLAAAMASAALMAWNLGTPALWRDEAASAVAQRRTWPQLWELLGGPEAPLVPFYAVLKTLTMGTLEVIPSAGMHLEELVRWPSAVAVVISSCVLVVWLTRVASPLLAAAAGSVFLLLAAVSRYGQEARPYALVLMFAVLATVLWWQVAHDRRWRWMPAYALVIAAMVALHALSASLIAAHIVAAAVLQPGHAQPQPLRWVARMLRTLGAALAGVLIASPLTLLAIGNGTGAAGTGDLVKARDVFLRLFNGASQPSEPVIVLLVVLLAVLPVIAVVAGWSGPMANVVRLSAAWAVVPLAVLLPAALARPNLIATRYLLFVVPGWAVLAAVGLVAAAGAVAAVLARILPFAHRRVVLGAGLVLALAAATVVQVPTLTSARSPHGHGENVRALLEIANSPQYRDLPIEVFPPSEAVQLSAYAPDQAFRLINARQLQTGAVIWPERVEGGAVTDALRDAPGVVVMVRGGTDLKVPRTWKDCRVVRTEQPDRKWSLYVLENASNGSSAGTGRCSDL